jgi:hypothetical protein
MAVLFVALLFVCSQEAANKFEIPQLGTITLPAGTWELEESREPNEGAHVFVYRKDSAQVERITVVRFAKHQGNRGLTKKDSYSYCDSIATSVFYAGKSTCWSGQPADKDLIEASSNHMIRLPKKESTEPLSVTNICSSETGKHWMNHGLIASDKDNVFLFIHTSSRLLSPETIENVYFSSPLETWPVAAKDGG